MREREGRERVCVRERDERECVCVCERERVGVVPESLHQPWTPVLALVLPAHSSQFENNHFTEICCGTEAGSCLRLIDSCITPLKAQGPSRTCNESKEEEEAS